LVSFAEKLHADLNLKEIGLERKEIEKRLKELKTNSNIDNYYRSMSRRMQNNFS